MAAIGVTSQECDVFGSLSKGRGGTESVPSGELFVSGPGNRTYVMLHCSGGRCDDKKEPGKLEVQVTLDIDPRPAIESLYKKYEDKATYSAMHREGNCFITYAMKDGKLSETVR